MSLYHMLRGVSGVTFLVLPMLGKHPDAYPRFRDCFLSDEEHPEHVGRILVYTRVGGGNRDDYASEIEALRHSPQYVTDYDDSFDSTYAMFVFAVPEEWQSDYDKIAAGDLKGVSDAYVEKCCSVFPKIEEKLRNTFKGD